MSEGINQVTIAGHLGADPDLRYGANGGAILKMRIAVGERYKDKSGEWVDKTEWVSAVMFGRRAEGVAKILGKGATVMIVGKLRTTSYEKDGAKRYSTEVAVDSIVLGGGKGQGRPTAQAAPSGEKASEADFGSSDFADLDILF